MSQVALLRAVWEQSRVWLCFVAVLILLSVALFVYQSQFATPETVSLLKQQQLLQQQLKEREAEQEQSSVPVSTIEQRQRDLQAFVELVPVKQEFADFLGDLFVWAEQAELEIRQISYRPELDKETNYLHYGLSFSVEGTYGQVKKFIHLLENSKRILIIDRISLGGKRNKDNSATVTLQINLTTIFREVAL